MRSKRGREYVELCSDPLCDRLDNSATTQQTEIYLLLLENPFARLSGGGQCLVLMLSCLAVACSLFLCVMFSTRLIFHLNYVLTYRQYVALRTFYFALCKLT